MVTKEKIRDIVAEILEIPVEELGFDTEMDEISEWDSMRNVMILFTLEEKFDIMFPEDDIFDLTSIKALTDEVNNIING